MGLGSQCKMIVHQEHEIHPNRNREQGEDAPFPQIEIPNDKLQPMDEVWEWGCHVEWFEDAVLVSPPH
jgi:hypothetical protein